MNGFEQLHEYILSWTDAGQWQKSEEIVRCRDCERATIDQGDHDYREPLWCSLHRMDVPPDGYCAWGERRGV